MAQVRVVLVDEDDDQIAEGTVECDTVTDVQVIFRGDDIYVLSEWSDPEDTNPEPAVYKLTGVAVFTEETDDADAPTVPEGQDASEGKDESGQDRV